MKDNTLRESLNDILAKAVVGEHYILVNANGTKTVNLARKRIEALLAEEVRKAVVKELKDIKNKFANAELFRGDPKNKLQIEDIYKHFFDNDIKPLVESVLNDRIKQLEKGK